MTNLKLDLNFFDTHDLKTLGVVDTSRYPSNFTIINPTIEITPPSFEKKNITFHTNAFNIYNSNTLSLTCGACDLADLPDGIWYIRYSISPAATNFVERSFIRMDKLKSRLEEIFLCTDITECDGNVKWEKLNSIDQIEVFINGAIAAANQCNNILAIKLYNVADKMITNFLKTC